VSGLSLGDSRGYTAWHNWVTDQIVEALLETRDWDADKADPAGP